MATTWVVFDQVILVPECRFRCFHVMDDMSLLVLRCAVFHSSSLRVAYETSGVSVAAQQLLPYRTEEARSAHPRSPRFQRSWVASVDAEK